MWVNLKAKIRYRHVKSYHSLCDYNYFSYNQCITRLSFEIIHEFFITKN